MDLPYRVQDTVDGQRRAVYREAADPSVVLFRGRYYLFPSVSGGFWHSADLVTWDFVSTPALPVYDYAPDVREIDGHLVVCASRAREPCNFYRSADPLGGTWEEIAGTFAFWDPNLFQDDDGRVYLYHGCSPADPVKGVELDGATFQRAGDTAGLIASDAARRGWERAGATYMEGAWMTKRDGTYYLQYAAPGTELSTYCDGYCTADSPLGPFEYSPHSPFSSKPGGFITAAGHGSTFQDKHGNWWHAATMRVSKAHMFERRLGLFPAGFDTDGVLFCNQEFADYPMTIPDGPADPWSLSAAWMLLSYGCPVTASGSAPGHPPGLAVDEDIRTWWKAPDAEDGHWISVELPAGATVHAIQVNFAEDGLTPPEPPRGARQGFPYPRLFRDGFPVHYRVEGSRDGSAWTTIHDARGDDSGRSHPYLELAAPGTYRHVRVTGFGQPYGAPLAVSGLRVFGAGAGTAPAAVAVTARRTGPLDARLTWTAAAGARGYNVRYGLSPGQLYHSWLLYGRTRLDLPTLNAGHDYWVAVDSFSENGVTRGTPVPIGDP
jgi:hypothetical protein